MLQPVVRRTWAPRGQTPLQWQWDRHDRVSVISAITLAPRRRRIGLYWEIWRQNICGEDVVAFLRDVRRHLRRDITLILDRWSVHKGRTVQEYLQDYAAEIHVEWLPGYAPELNPDEQVWNHSKYSDLANFSPANCDQLELHVELSLRKQRVQSSLLRSFFKTAELPL